MTDLVRGILNIIWLLFGGLWLALGYVLAGIICCLLIVTIPFGIASFRIAGYALWPFGRTVVDRGPVGAFSTLGNIIWLVFAGIWIAIGHVVTAIPMFVSIIGIPLGIANLKMIPVSLMPLGKKLFLRIITSQGCDAKFYATKLEPVPYGPAFAYLVVSKLFAVGAAGFVRAKYQRAHSAGPVPEERGVGPKLMARGHGGYLEEAHHRPTLRELYGTAK